MISCQENREILCLSQEISWLTSTTTICSQEHGELRKINIGTPNILRIAMCVENQNIKECIYITLHTKGWERKGFQILFQYANRVTGLSTTSKRKLNFLSEKLPSNVKEPLNRRSPDQESRGIFLRKEVSNNIPLYL